MDSTIPLSFESPESSSILSASYDPDTRLLTVVLKTGTYTYEGFPEAKWEDFVEAESKGKYFAHYIRPLFYGTKKS